MLRNRILINIFRNEKNMVIKRYWIIDKTNFVQHIIFKSKNSGLREKDKIK